jgi:hypothetical protein
MSERITTLTTVHACVCGGANLLKGKGLCRNVDRAYIIELILSSIGPLLVGVMYGRPLDHTYLR